MDGSLKERKRRTSRCRKGWTRDTGGTKKSPRSPGGQFGEIQLELFPDERYASDTVTALKADSKWDSKLKSELVSRFDVMIAGGWDNSKGSCSG